MQCPKCGKEMEKGYLRNPRGVIAWTPDGEKANVLQSRVKENQVELGTHTGLGVTTVAASYCPDCALVLIENHGK